MNQNTIASRTGTISLASLLGLALLAGGCTTEIASDSNEVATKEKSIVGGSIATPHAYPWQVQLRTTTADGRVENCGGTLLTNRWVLTAAHCVDENDDGDPVLGGYAFFGMHNMDTVDAEQIRLFYGSGVHINPNYSSGPGALPGHNDMALVYLSSTVALTGGVATIALDNSTCNRPRPATTRRPRVCRVRSIATNSVLATRATFKGPVTAIAVVLWSATFRLRPVGSTNSSA